VLSVAAGTGDIIDIIAFKSFTVADALSAVSGGTVNGPVTVTGAGSIQGLTVGRGAGAVSTNTAVGASALQANTSGNAQTVFGYNAMYTNTTGAENTAIGYNSLYYNTTGNNNVAVGRSALQSNTTASNNTAVGYQAGFTGTTAVGNTYVGYQAGYSVATGNTYNTMLGFQAGQNTTSTYNTFVGTQAGQLVTSGGKNTILGLYNGNQSGLDIRTASNRIVLSDGDGTPRVSIDSTGSTQFFGYNTIQASTLSGADTSSANAIFAGRYGATTPLNGTACIFITSNGNIYNTNALYGTLSDAKLKENIVDASSQWDDIKALRVRNFNLKEGQTHTQIGYIAQEVEVVSPSLVDTNPDVDAEGNELGTTTKSLKLSVINIKAVKALQEAMDRIEKLEAELAAMKGTS
jgi:hypothetical protein